MELSYVLTWVVVANCVFTAVQAYLNPVINSKGWIPISLLVLAVTALLYLFQPAIAGFVALGLMLLFIVLPSRLFHRINRLRANDEFEQVLVIGKVMRWLHPFYNWQQWADNVNASRYEYSGQIEKANQLLEKYRSPKDFTGQHTAMHIELNRSDGDWQHLKEWFEQEINPEQIVTNPLHLFHYLRALGETGALNEMVHYFNEHLTLLAKDYYSLLNAYIIVFAFCGQQTWVAALVNDKHCLWDEKTKRAWLGTTYLAAGDIETGQQILKSLLQTRDARLHKTLTRRLAQGVSLANDSLTNESIAILNQIDQNLQTWKHKQADAKKIATPAVAYGLLIINIIIFAIEMWQGAATNIEVLIEMGALWPIMLIYGEGYIWSLLAANFLHINWVHLLLNMFALYILGPILEVQLGRFRFLFIYLASGLGASLIIVWLTSMSILPENSIYLGASACILGLFGAELALALQSWRLQKFARDRIVMLLVYLAIQISFDLFTPSVSLTAHLAGFTTGFLFTSIVYRLTPA